MPEIEKLQRRIVREKNARKEAERLLEEKSAALYDKNMELYALSESLEKLVAERTMQMQNARDDALKALKVKTDFIANMSHELRTPMNGVLGVLALLQNESLSGEQQELVGIAESSGKHLLSVINDILDFSKIEANKISIDLAPVEIRPYLKNVIAPFALQAEQKGIVLNFSIDDAVEKGLVTDKLKLTQIITNLLSNAIKFTDKGSVTFNMRRKQGNHYQISVEDTGIGISQENITAVFAAFEQADTSITREFGGTGLGMNITKHLVDMLNGDIRVTSKLRQGTTFYVDIEMAPTDIDASAASSLEDVKSHSDNTRLLLVEDHDVNQLVAKRLLESWGYTVVIAENGQEALDTLSNEVFDAVLMDLQMPIMGGIEATKIIRRELLISDCVPVIAMTSHNSDEHIEECLQAGMQDHVSKPLDTLHLMSVLQRHINTNHELSAIDSNQKTDLTDSIDITHVDTQAGIKRVGGDISIYYELVERFLNEFADFSDAFQSARQQKDAEQAITLLHKLKGGGGNLGMTEISSHAAIYESELSRQNVWPADENINQLHEQLLQIKASFEILTDPRELNIPLKKQIVDDQTIVVQIDAITSSLKQDVFAAEDGLKELLSFQVKPKVEKALGDAQAAISVFDIESASLSLQSAKSMMEL